MGGNDRKFKRRGGWIHKFQHPSDERKVQTKGRNGGKWDNGNIKE